jgi:poly-gamma-glutamate capsule biosynthesis protein CapA/YwtB (metallophosphatase superfamily)
MDARIYPSQPRSRDQAKELANKIVGPFDVVAVGDMIQMYPFASSPDPDIKCLIDIMRRADVVAANGESSILDYDQLLLDPGSNTYAHGLVSTKEVADDYKYMGINVLNKANNHALHCGLRGLQENGKQLARVGISSAGAGATLEDARMPRYVYTSKGAVSTVGVYMPTVERFADFGIGTRTEYVNPEQLAQIRTMRDSIVARRNEVDYPIMLPVDRPNEILLFGIYFRVKPADGSAMSEPASSVRFRNKGEGGATNNLMVGLKYGVTADQLKQLAVIAGQRFENGALSAFGRKFFATEKPGDYDYDVNIDDWRAILANVRTAKQFSHFEIVQLHGHQNRNMFQAYGIDHFPPAFQVRLAHDVIDNGADVVVMTGVHSLRGVEIYKEKPIFYGLNSFVSHSQNFNDGGKSTPPPSAEGPILGLGEINEDRSAWVQRTTNKRSVLAKSEFSDGKLKRVALYPVDLGEEGRVFGLENGTPKKPSSAQAARILADLQVQSRPFGTRIDIENDVGIIRIP